VYGRHGDKPYLLTEYDLSNYDEKKIGSRIGQITFNKEPIFSEVLLQFELVVWFQQTKPTIIIERHKFQQDKLLDNILAESSGMLLWCHQAEVLFRLFGMSHSDASKAVESMLKDTAEWKNIAAQYKFYDGRTLEDVITERMIFGYIKRPHYLGAYNLYKVFCQHIIEK